MQRGDVFVVDLVKVLPEVDRALKGKYALAWCTGPVDTSWMPKPTPHVKVVLADTLFDAPPTKIPTLRARTFVHRTPNVPAVSCVPDEALPRGVTLLGTIAKLPRVEDYVLFGYWAGLVRDLHYSWLDEHAPAPAAKPPAARKPRKLGKVLLPEWTGLVEARHVKAVRALLREAVATKLTKPAMRKLVDAINAYNDKHNFIDTPEREALMQTLEDIAAAHGLGMMTKQLNNWRDW